MLEAPIHRFNRGVNPASDVRVDVTKVGLGNGPNTSTARAVAFPGMENLYSLPFVDIPFQHLVSSLSILHLAYFVLE